MSRSILMVIDLINPSPEPFAVLSVDLDQPPAEGGGVVGIVVSLHMTREDADRVVLSGPPSETRQ